MLSERDYSIEPRREQGLKVRRESMPIVGVPAETTGRDGTAAIFYMGLFAILPTIGFALWYQMAPIAALLVLPGATFTAWHLSTRRYAAYEDTPPGHAAFVMSCLVWLALVVTWPATLAFDVARTIIWQLIAGGFIAVMGPGVAKRWADLPRQIYIQAQPLPPPPQQHQQPQVISGTSFSDFDDVHAQQEAYMDQNDSHQQPPEDIHDPYFDDDDMNTI